MDKYALVINSPIGLLTLIEENGFLVELSFGDTVNYQNTIIEETPLLVQTKKELDEYFLGQRTSFNIPYKLNGTTFQQKVWNALTKIPYGKTISYQGIAINVGNKKAVRAVGGANNKNPIAIIIPCHRVIGKNSKLIGYGGGLDKKIFLLNLEKTGVLHS